MIISSRRFKVGELIHLHSGEKATVHAVHSDGTYTACTEHIHHVAGRPCNMFVVSPRIVYGIERPLFPEDNVDKEEKEAT